MAFQGELVFEGLEDRLDPLALAGEVPEAWFLVLAVGAEQVRAPEPAGMRCTVPVPGVPGQVRAADRLPRRRAGQRRGVHQAQQVMPRRRVACQLGDHRGEQPGLRAQPLAVPCLARQRREQPAKVRAGIADPATPAGDAAQAPGYGQASIEFHLQCGQEGVQVARHKTIFDALRLTFRPATRAKI